MSAVTAAAALEWDLGDRLRKSLRASGVSVGEMAQELGVSRHTVGGWINGRHRPSRAAVVVWSIRTGVPLEWLEHGRATVTST